MARQPVLHTMHKAKVTAKGRFFQIDLDNEVFIFPPTTSIRFNVNESALRELHRQLTELIQEIDNNGN